MFLISIFSATSTLNTKDFEIMPDSDYDGDEDYSMAELNLQQKSADLTHVLEDENDDDEYGEWYKCDKDLRKPRGFRRFLDLPFLKKFVRNLSPFTRPRLQMNFYLFTREFPDCGKELVMTDDSLLTSGLNASHPTR